MAYFKAQFLYLSRRADENYTEDLGYLGCGPNFVRGSNPARKRTATGPSRFTCYQCYCRHWATRHCTRTAETGAWKEWWYSISCLYKQTDLQTEVASQLLHTAATSTKSLNGSPVKKLLDLWKLKVHSSVNKILPYVCRQSPKTQYTRIHYTISAYILTDLIFISF